MLAALALVLPLAANAAPSYSHYTYVAGGMQFADIDSDDLTQYIGAPYSKMDTEQLYGVYFNASFSTARIPVFFKAELSGMYSSELEIENTFGGIGLYQYFGNHSVYGAVGYNKVEVSRETDQFVREFNEGGASGEVGVNLQVLPFYKLVPRARFTRLAGEIMDDYQLSNQIMFGPVLAVELNIGHNKFQDTSQTSYQAGIRFSF
ncbi:hypothetical protein DU972_001490 [Vibrio mimicus]